MYTIFNPGYKYDIGRDSDCLFYMYVILSCAQPDLVV